MKKIDTGKCQLLAVEVPEGVCDYEFINANDKTAALFVDFVKDGEPDTVEVELPPGNYSIIGRANEITEGQAREIVDGDGGSFYDYKLFRGHLQNYTETALDSFRSLCEAYGITNQLILKVNE